MRYTILVLLGGVLAYLSYDVLAFSPLLPTPYKTEVGQYVFVMLPGYCAQAVAQEVEMTHAEFSAFQTKLHKKGQPMPRSDPCAEEARIMDGDVSVSRGVGRWHVFSASRDVDDLGKWQVSVNAYTWTITERLRSESGREYPASGLYHNDGSITPLWTVAWYAGAFETYPSRHGRYLVRINDGRWLTLGDEPDDFAVYGQGRLMEEYTYDSRSPGWSHIHSFAVAFYDRGRLMKEYTVSELVEQPERLSHDLHSSRWSQNISFDDKAKTVTIKTFNDELHVFDITSGKIRSSTWNPMPRITATATFRSGVIQTFSHFGTCYDAVPLPPREHRQQGPSAGLNLYGYVHTSGSEKEAYPVRIPLPALRMVRNVSPNQQAKRLTWHVYLKSGGMWTIAVDSDMAYYCGRATDGRIKAIPARAIEMITFP